VGVRREHETEKGVGDGAGAKGTEGRETSQGWERVVDVIEKGEKKGVVCVYRREHDCVYAQTFL